MIATRALDLMTAEPKLLRQQRHWLFQPGLATIGGRGRLEVWEAYNPEHDYAVGADFALGLEGRDYDSAVVLDYSVSPVRQVAVLHGHWGETFDRPLYALLRYYGGPRNTWAFLCGERQYGLPCLQRLYTEYQVGWMYYDRDEDVRTRRMTAKLGYWRSVGDIAVPRLARAIADKKIILRDRETIRQVGKLQWVPKNKAADPAEVDDKGLKMKLSGGGSPDLAMALAYAWLAAEEVPKFEKPKLALPAHSLGAILGGHDEVE